MNRLLAQSGLLPDPLGVVLPALAGVVMLVLVVLLVNFGLIYIRAMFSGAKVTFTELIALRLRRVPLGMVVDNRIAAVRSGLPLSIDNLSTHHLAGGNSGGIGAAGNGRGLARRPTRLRQLNAEASVISDQQLWNVLHQKVRSVGSWSGAGNARRRICTPRRTAVTPIGWTASSSILRPDLER